ncbi:MAG TPA: hypothetical protein VNN80_14605 [Polyangiaceae bacterium]|nr:hypothetical protein [Polyangiaceae bacterium]
MALAVMARAASAQANEPQAGLTFDVAVGAGVTQTSTFAGFFSGGGFGGFYSNDTTFALMLPAVSLGGRLSPTVSLGGRISNLWYVPGDDDIINGYAGIELRYLPSVSWMMAGGLGVQLLEELSYPEVGAGADLRAAYLPFSVGASRLGFVTEVVTGYVDADLTYSASLALLWLLS